MGGTAAPAVVAMGEWATLRAVSYLVDFTCTLFFLDGLIHDHRTRGAMSGCVLATRVAMTTVERIFQRSDLANAVRRYALDQTTTVAPGYVTIRRNDTVMTDAQLAQRIGGLLLDNRSCQVDDTLQLTVQGTSQRHVMASELVASDPRTTLVGYAVPLTIINPGQHLDLTVHLRRACGAEHQRFSPFAVARYRRDGSAFRVELEPTGAQDAGVAYAEALARLQVDSVALRDRLAKEPPAVRPAAASREAEPRSAQSAQSPQPA